MFEVTGIVGSILSGVITDLIYSYQSTKLAKMSNKLESIQIRMTLNLIYLLGIIISLHLFTFYLKEKASKIFIYSISSLLGFLCYGSISLLGTSAMEFTHKKYSGSSHAIAALASNIGAIFAGIPFGLLSRFYSWSLAFFVVEILAIFICVFSYFCKNSKCKFDVVPIDRKNK